MSAERLYDSEANHFTFKVNYHGEVSNLQTITMFQVFIILTSIMLLSAYPICHNLNQGHDSGLSGAVGCWQDLFF